MRARKCFILWLNALFSFIIFLFEYVSMHEYVRD